MKLQPAGYLEAWPNPCPILDNGMSSLTRLDWDTTGAARVNVTVQSLDGDEKSVSHEPVGSLTLDQMKLGDQLTYRLYDVAGEDRVLLDALVITTTRVSYDLPPAGALTLMPCTVAEAGDRGTTLVTWRTRGLTKAQATLQIDSAPEVTFSERLGGSLPFSGVQRGHQYVFRLFDLSRGGRVLLSEAGLEVRTGALIEARPNPCLVAHDGDHGMTSLAWAAPGDLPSEVTIQARGGEEQTFSTVPRGHLRFGDVRLGTWYVFRLYDTSAGQHRLLDSLVVLGEQVEREVIKSGTITASSSLLLRDESGAPDVTSIHWATQNLDRVEVRMQAGVEETLVATTTSGSQTITNIPSDTVYVFRLYDASHDEPILLDEVTVAAL